MGENPEDGSKEILYTDPYLAAELPVFFDLAGIDLDQNEEAGDDPSSHSDEELQFSFRAHSKEEWGFDWDFSSLPFKVADVYRGKQAEKLGLHTGDKMTLWAGEAIDESNRERVQQILCRGDAGVLAV